MITFLTAWLKKHHWIHDWGPWKRCNGIAYPFSMKSMGLEVTMQSRTCKTCNKQELEY